MTEFRFWSTYNRTTTEGLLIYQFYKYEYFISVALLTG
jgi:hypothetical protein